MDLGHLAACRGWCDIFEPHGKPRLVVASGSWQAWFERSAPAPKARSYIKVGSEVLSVGESLHEPQLVLNALHSYIVDTGKTAVAGHSKEGWMGLLHFRGCNDVMIGGAHPVEVEHGWNTLLGIGHMEKIADTSSSSQTRRWQSSMCPIWTEPHYCTLGTHKVCAAGEGHLLAVRACALWYGRGMQG